MSKYWSVIVHALACGSIIGWAAPASSSDKVPFKSCQSDGQQGPQKPLRRPDGAALPDVPAASGLAFFQASGTPAVLGPRGWHCVGLEGSNGGTLVLTPEVHKPREFIFGKTALKGPAIEITYLFADTSGRFAVAEMAARLFPKAASFVQSVSDDNDQIAGAKLLYPTGPYPDDHLTYRSDFTVEYVTPANRKGMGTHTFLEPNSAPIEGIVLMDPDGNDMVQLAVRLPASLRRLSPLVIADVAGRKNFH